MFLFELICICLGFEKEDSKLFSAKVETGL